MSIQLKREVFESEFIYNLKQKELNKIILEKQIKSKSINIYDSYVFNNEKTTSIGLYIINTSNKEVAINCLPIKIIAGNNIIHKMNLKIDYFIRSNEAIFHEIVISDLNTEAYEYKYIEILIDDEYLIRKNNLVDIDLNDIPKITGYRNNREMKKFIKGLSTIKKDELRIDVFKVAEAENGFGILSLFRNSSDKKVNIKSLPISVYTSHGLLIYKGVYTINDDSLKIESNKGKLYYIEIPFSNFLKIEGHDLSTYKVEFK